MTLRKEWPTARGVIVVILSTALGVGLLIYLVSRLGLPSIRSLLSQISADTMAVLMLLLIISDVLRAYRFRIVYRDRGLTFPLSIAIVFMSNCLGSLLPARLGDFSYPWFLKRGSGIRYSSGLSMLFLLRFFDLFAVSVLFIISALAVPMAADWGGKVFYLAALLLCVALAVPLIAMYAAKNWRIREANLRFKLLRRVADFVRQALAALREVNSPRVVLALAITSLLIWLSNYAFGFFLVYRLSVTEDLAAAFFALNLSNLVNLVPVQNVAGLGTAEGSWTAAFAVVGVSAETAFPAGFLTHMLRLGFSILLAFLGAIFFWLRRRPAMKRVDSVADRAAMD